MKWCLFCGIALLLQGCGNAGTDAKDAKLKLQPASVTAGNEDQGDAARTPPVVSTRPDARREGRDAGPDDSKRHKQLAKLMRQRSRMIAEIEDVGAPSRPVGQVEFPVPDARLEEIRHGGAAEQEQQAALRRVREEHRVPAITVEDTPSSKAEAHATASERERAERLAELEGLGRDLAKRRHRASVLVPSGSDVVMIDPPVGLRREDAAVARGRAVQLLTTDDRISASRAAELLAAIAPEGRDDLHRARAFLAQDLDRGLDHAAQRAKAALRRAPDADFAPRSAPAFDRAEAFAMLGGHTLLLSKAERQAQERRGGYARGTGTLSSAHGQTWSYLFLLAVLDLDGVDVVTDLGYDFAALGGGDDWAAFKQAVADYAGFEGPEAQQRVQPANGPGVAPRHLAAWELETHLAANGEPAIPFDSQWHVDTMWQNRVLGGGFKGRAFWVYDTCSRLHDLVVAGESRA